MGRTFIAFEGTVLGRLLDEDVENALSQAITVIDDQFIEEIAARFVCPDRGNVRSFSDEHLPRIYRHLYSAGFVRRLHVCFVQVVAHLATDPWVGLACRGEEFVLDALLNQTRSLAEMDDLPPDSEAKLEHALTQLAEEAFDDFDYAFAFDPAADGIDDFDTEQGYQLGISMPLHPRAWFEPFGNAPVHPLAKNWDEQNDQRSESEERLEQVESPSPVQTARASSNVLTLQLNSFSSSRWFDCYLMVDWSANNKPKSGADSIWTAFGFWDGASFVEKSPINFSTRFEAMRYVRQVAQVDRRMRLMVGFDFPYSYPVGMTAAGDAIFGPGPQWRSVWAAFSSRITDDPNNKNNRFKVADDINRLCNTRFFWGRPRGASYDELFNLPETDIVPSGLKPNPCHRWRLVDSTAKGGIKSVWQIFAGVTVGGQALTGIPHLEALREAFPDRLIVWPFESGVSPERNSYDKPITLVEIWPSAVPVDATLEPVRDASQVRSVVRWCAQRDVADDWSKWLAPATALSDEPRLMEEGWILGVQ